MLHLQNICIRRGPSLLLRHVSFQAHAGQRMGLIGANGSGKSSLFAMLLGELEADDGELQKDPNDVIAHVSQESPDTVSPAIGYVMDGDQELRVAERAIADIEAVPGSDPAGLHLLYEKMEAIDAYTAEARAARLLDGLGFSTADLAKPVREFSGGWRMRLNLARALMCRSDILLLDEPTNHLDLPAILWLERWLKRYAGILIVVSHDRDFLDEVCTRVAHIENLEVRLYTGNYSQFEAQRSEQLAQQQAMFSRQQKDIQHIQSFVDRFRYKASKARQAQSRLKMLERMTLIAPAHSDSPFRFRFAAPEKQPQHLLGLTNANLGYDDDIVLANVTLNLTAGDRVGLLGVNGAGKSTLVKALASGSTLQTGDRLISKDTRIGYFAQHQLDLLEPGESPLEHVRKLDPTAREAEIRNFLGRFNFGGERIFDPVEPFSGGEKARLALALIIHQKPNLLLLDEPTNHLDLEMRQALSMALIEYAGALVVISHDRHLLRSVCDELQIVHDGFVERFKQSLDEYPQWLKNHAQQAAPDDLDAPAAEATRPLNKKQQRQQDAELRQQQKPLRDEIRQAESSLDSARGRLAKIEIDLAQEAIYQDSSRKDELRAVIREQAELKSRIELLEDEWLQASERLEALSKD